MAVTSPWGHRSMSFILLRPLPGVPHELTFVHDGSRYSFRRRLPWVKGSMADNFTDIAVGVVAESGRRYVSVSLLAEDGSGHQILIEPSLAKELAVALVDAAIAARAAGDG